MPDTAQIHLFGSLQQTPPSGTRRRIDIDLAAPLPLNQLLLQTRIPRERVQMAMVNHKAVPIDTQIKAGDRVALFPKEYPIFVDWKDYRI